MPRDVDMYIRDPTTGVLRLATRSEEREALQRFPRNFRAEGAWVCDEAEGPYRQATRAEAREMSHGEPSNWQYERPRRHHRRRRHMG
ncbi:hypothetical protein diail_12228 [Diaporthe ilicicola]|nr:hypothetical protein diail_12228 [Diaporthe ilicicola]